MRNDYQAVLAAPFGAVGIVVADGKLSAIDLLPERQSARPAQDPETRKICDQVAEYLRNAQAPFTVPLSNAGTAFQQRVWRAIQAIPCGTTLTYSELAAHVGSGPRAVANACGANSIPIVIPCHRVVAKSGLGGFMQGKDANSLAIKQWLLAHERSQSSAA